MEFLPLCQPRPDLVHAAFFALAFLSVSNNQLAGPLPPVFAILNVGKSSRVSR